MSCVCVGVRTDASIHKRELQNSIPSCAWMNLILRESNLHSSVFPIKSGSTNSLVAVLFFSYYSVYYVYYIYLAWDSGGGDQTWKYTKKINVNCKHVSHISAIKSYTQHIFFGVLYIVHALFLQLFFAIAVVCVCLCVTIHLKGYFRTKIHFL